MSAPALYNAGVSATVARVIVVAGALMQPQWLPPAELRSRLPRLAQLGGLGTVDVELPATSDTLPRELAHDRWLREQLAREVGGPVIAPGAMTAVRQLAPFSQDLSGWLLEPVHLHLAKDHVVLLAGASRGLSTPQAHSLIESIDPVLADDDLAVSVLSPTLWHLGASASAALPRPLQLACASFEAAAGRNIDGYLPKGDDARRYRKLFNEVQMTWHEHPVNQEREARGELPINGFWLSGPVAPAALAAWHGALAQERYALDDILLEPRLRDDQWAWLEALQAMDARLHELLTSDDAPSVLLCGDNGVRWLQRKAGGRERWSAAIGNSMAGLARRARLLVPRRAATVRAGTAQSSRHPVGNTSATDPLVQMFIDLDA